MKRTLFLALAVVGLAASTGCCCLERLFCCRSGCHNSASDCDDCGGAGCDSCGAANNDGGCSSCSTARKSSGGHPLARAHRNLGGEYEVSSSPATGTVSYPYYTNRGPRDFLAKNPRSIGP